MAKTKMIIALFIGMILVGGPAAAETSPLTFGALTYSHGWNGVDDGINHASIQTGVRIAYGDWWRLYVGMEMADFAPTYDNGHLVKSNQGGIGPLLYYSMDLTWGPRLPSGKPALGVIAFASYLDDMVQEDNGDMTSAGIGGLALRISLSDEDALAAGFEWHSAYGGFIETTSVGGGAIIGNPIKKITSVPIGIGKGIVKGVKLVGGLIPDEKDQEDADSDG